MFLSVFTVIACLCEGFILVCHHIGLDILIIVIEVNICTDELLVTQFINRARMFGKILFLEHRTTM